MFALMSFAVGQPHNLNFKVSEVQAVKSLINQVVAFYYKALVWLLFYSP